MQFNNESETTTRMSFVERRGREGEREEEDGLVRDGKR